MNGEKYLVIEGGVLFFSTEDIATARDYLATNGGALYECIQVLPPPVVVAEAEPAPSSDYRYVIFDYDKHTHVLDLQAPWKTYCGLGISVLECYERKGPGYTRFKEAEVGTPWWCARCVSRWVGKPAGRMP